MRTSLARPRIAGADTRGKVFVLRTDLITAETRALLLAVARVVLSGRRGSLADQVERMQPMPTRRAARCRAAPRRAARPRRRCRSARASWSSSTASAASRAQGREYVITAAGGQTTPAPWINVIANRGFGFQCRRDGARLHLGAQQPRERADALVATIRSATGPGEAIYLRDEETGELWTPDAGADPPRAARTTPARTASGYSRFEQRSHGIALELTMFVPLEDPVKICRLRVRNESPRRRSLSVTRLRRVGAGPVAHAGRAARHHRARRGTRRAVRAQSLEHRRFPASRSPTCAAAQTECTCDRREFLGRHGTLDAPAALVPARALAGRAGAGARSLRRAAHALRARARREHRDSCSC